MIFTNDYITMYLSICLGMVSNNIYKNGFKSTIKMPIISELGFFKFSLALCFWEFFADHLMPRLLDTLIDDLVHPEWTFFLKVIETYIVFLFQAIYIIFTVWMIIKWPNYDGKNVNNLNGVDLELHVSNCYVVRMIFSILPLIIHYQGVNWLRNHLLKFNGAMYWTMRLDQGLWPIDRLAYRFYGDLSIKYFIYKVVDLFIRNLFCRFIVLTAFNLVYSTKCIAYESKCMFQKLISYFK